MRPCRFRFDESDVVAVRHCVQLVESIWRCVAVQVGCVVSHGCLPVHSARIHKAGPVKSWVKTATKTSNGVYGLFPLLVGCGLTASGLDAVKQRCQFDEMSFSHNVSNS